MSYDLGSGNQFVVVVIAAMVYHGDVVVAYRGKITAANFEGHHR